MFPASTQSPETMLVVKEGLVVFDIIPVAPYLGFSRLFAAE